MVVGRWAVFAAFFLWAGCTNNNEPTGTNEEDAADVVTEEIITEGALNHNRLFPQLSAFLQSEDPAARQGQFILSESVENPAALQTQPQDTAALRPYQPFLIYNSDRTKVLDLFSYSHLVERQGDSVVLEGGEPDREVGVVDLKNNTRRRVFFAGPSYLVLEGAWEGDSVVLLAVAERLEGVRVLPQIHRISLKDGSADLYRLSDTLRVNVPAYLIRRYR